MNIPGGSLDQYIRIIAYLLAILFCLTLGLTVEVKRLRGVFLALAFLLGIQLASVLFRVFGAPDWVPFIQVWCLTPALCVLVWTLVRCVQAIGLRI